MYTTVHLVLCRCGFYIAVKQR